MLICGNTHCGLQHVGQTKSSVMKRIYLHKYLMDDLTGEDAQTYSTALYVFQSTEP